MDDLMGIVDWQRFPEDAWSRVKTAVFAPIPSARERIAVSA
jgi:hypothetical protein